MAQLFETVCMSLVFNKSHSLAMHYCRLVWDVRSLSDSFIRRFLINIVPIVSYPMGKSNTELA